MKKNLGNHPVESTKEFGVRPGQNYSPDEARDPDGKWTGGGGGGSSAGKPDGHNIIDQKQVYERTYYIEQVEGMHQGKPVTAFYVTSRGTGAAYPKGYVHPVNVHSVHSNLDDARRAFVKIYKKAQG